MASVKQSRRWSRMGLKGRSKILRLVDTGQRYKPRRRCKRWNWSKK